MNRGIDELLEKMDKETIDLKSTEFGNDEIDKIYTMTMDKISREKETDTDYCKTDRKHFSKKLIRRIGIAAIAATLVTGTVAYGAVHWNDKFSRFFGVNDGDNTQQVASMDVNKSYEVNGVTVTAKQVVGDGQGLYLLLQVKGSDRTAIDFENIDVKIDDTDSVQTSNLMCMGIDDGVGSYILSISSPEKLIGKNISLTLKDFGYAKDDKFITVNKGTWKLKWKLDYEVKTTKYNVNKKVNIYGGTAKFDNVVLSPLSATVNLSELENIKETMTGDENQNDRLIVNFMDGSAVNSDYDENVINDTDKITIYFHKIVSPDKIESITFAGVTVPITKNAKPIQYVHHDFKSMGFTIDMQKDLDDITKMREEEYYDNAVKAKGKKMAFTGTIDGVSMDMFDVIMLKTDITKDELDKRNSELNYLGCADGYVYALLYGEPITEDQLNKFTKIENKYIANILPRITVYGAQNSNN